MAKLFLLLGLAAVAVVVGYWGLLFFAQRSLLFPAQRLAGAPARPADAEQVWLPGVAGPTEAWFLPPWAAAAGRAPLILFAHGNAELIDLWPPAFAEPRRWGIGVLLVEYPGYGRSAGHSSQATVTAAMEAAFDWASARAGIDPRRIVAYGRSVGTGAACQVAARRPVAALILESGFTSVRAFARGYGAPPLLVRDPFDNLAVVRGFHAPLLLLHGRRDDIIPPHHSEALAAAAPHAELHLLDYGHNDCPRQWPLVRAFLSRHQLLPRASVMRDGEEPVPPAP